MCHVTTLRKLSPSLKSIYMAIRYRVVTLAASAIRDFVTLTFKGLTLDVDGPAT